MGRLVMLPFPYSYIEQSQFQGKYVAAFVTYPHGTFIYSLFSDPNDPQKKRIPFCFSSLFFVLPLLTMLLPLAVLLMKLFLFRKKKRTGIHTTQQVIFSTLHGRIRSRICRFPKAYTTPLRKAILSGSVYGKAYSAWNTTSCISNESTMAVRFQSKKSDKNLTLLSDF